MAQPKRVVSLFLFVISDHATVWLCAYPPGCRPNAETSATILFRHRRRRRLAVGAVRSVADVCKLTFLPKIFPARCMYRCLVAVSFFFKFDGGNRTTCGPGTKRGKI